MKSGREPAGLSIEESIKRLTDAVVPIRETETVSLADAVGRVMAEDLGAPFSLPAFPRSAMDGYALRSQDTEGASEDAPVKLRILGEQMAGDRDTFEVSEMTAVRIMTGAAVPEGYDAVIMQEDTEPGKGCVGIRRALKKGTNICPVGEDFSEGDLLLQKGKRIGRIEPGVAASAGWAKLPVLRRVKVAVISTGSELDLPGEPLAPGHIYGSISYMLCAGIPERAAEITGEITVPDEKEIIKQEILKARETSDIIITTGGVSVGKKDLLHEVLDELGANKLFYRSRIKPGSPTIGSIYEGKVILSLSGNPYAALANFDLYFYPVMAKLTGCKAFLRRRGKAVLAEPYEKAGKVRRLVRAYEEGGKVYLPEKNQKSSTFSDLARCNCYMDLPSGRCVSPGDTVDIIYM